MTNKQTTRQLFTVLLMLLLGTFTSAPLVRAQKPAAAKAASPSGPKEGIKVHGHWTIEVRNPDGKVATRHEFKNDLFNSGATLLADFLQRSAKAGEWAIFIGHPAGSSTGDTSPCLVGTQPANCVIAEPFSNQNFTSSSSFKTLTISSGTGNGNSKTTVLSGTATAQRDGIIKGVFTRLSTCPVEATGVCSSNLFTFTSRAFSSSEWVNVVAGQIIQVTVVISFS